MSGVISRFAGSLDASGIPNQGYSGDGSAATSATLYIPRNVAVDSLNNLYVADSSNNVIRKIDSSGIITTVAGDGTQGFSGDGSAATSATLNNPYGIAVDSSNNLYIADSNNRRVRKVTSGIITTIAGNGNLGYSGDGSAATSATFDYIQGVDVDSSGNLYIADLNNNAIRKIDSSGIITTVSSSVQIYSPQGIKVDSSRNLYVTESGYNKVSKIDSSGINTTIAGNGSPGYSGDGGAATSALLTNPSDIDIDSSGNLYIVDTGNHVIRKIDSSGIITTVAGDGSQGFSGDGGAATSAKLKNPQGIALDSLGNLYIADTVNNLVRKLIISSTPTAITIGVISGVTSSGFTVGFTGGSGVGVTYSAEVTTDFVSYTNPIAATSTTSSSVTFTGLQAYTDYSLQIFATNAAGTSQTNHLSVDANNAPFLTTQNGGGGGGNPLCFLRGSKILCLKDGNEQYLAIEEMRVGTEVKTLKGTYVKVHTIGKTMFNNPDNADRGPNRLFKLSPVNYPELTEDLIITGCHSRLVVKLEPQQKARHLQLMKNLYMTTDMFRLMAFIDEKAEPYINPGSHEIWHFALENEVEVCNYGVYANGGLLVETASIKNMRERSGLALIE